MPLQKVITDFGSDVSFEQVGVKLEEHYGITLPTSSIQKITKCHAEKIAKKFPLGLPLENERSKNVIIGESDGTMVPIVRFEEEKVADKRKKRAVCWKEAKLSFARGQQGVRKIFAATLGTADECGEQLFACAQKVGMTQQTHVHCIGDGAYWIREQVDRVFAYQGKYLIDFFHLSEYLSKASEKISDKDKKKWLEEKKDQMKNNHFQKVLKDLATRIPSIKNKECPLYTCYRYIKNCQNHLDYKGAQDQGLPIGSGEIESSHRTIIQKRLKIPGAWWLPQTAQNMLTLRCARFNGMWSSYWDTQHREVA